eukprot:9055438-Alexandrium_andersonii.AAC.1
MAGGGPADPLREDGHHLLAAAPEGPLPAPCGALRAERVSLEAARTRLGPLAMQVAVALQAEWDTWGCTLAP